MGTEFKDWFAVLEAPEGDKIIACFGITVHRTNEVRKTHEFGTVDYDSIKGVFREMGL